MQFVSEKQTLLVANTNVCSKNLLLELLNDLV